MPRIAVARSDRSLRQLCFRQKNWGCLRSPVGKAVLKPVFAYFPVPFRGTVCGLSAALSVSVTLPLRNPVWDGLNRTFRTQVFPAATVLPLTQDVLTTFSKKSPLIATVLIFSVAPPVLVRVTVFGPTVVPTKIFPHVSEVGVSVTTGPLAVTVSVTVVVEVKLPDVPVIVTVEVPVAAVALAVSVNVLVEVVGFGTNAAVTPLGIPVADNITLPLKPFDGTTVMVLVPWFPWLTVRVLGTAVRVKFGLPEQPVKANDPMFVFQLYWPLTFSYWFTYQNVQSSLGSTCMAV
jgi:hypothetical protein